MGSKQSKQIEEDEAPPPFDPQDWPWVWAIRDPEVLDWKRDLSFEEIQACALEQQDLPVPITENLYLGNAPCVDDVEKLKKLGIRAVLNVAGPLALRKATIASLEANGIVYKRITAQDEYDYPMLAEHWEEAEKFISSSIHENSGKIVVHCVAGMNRSALIVAAFYMLTTKTTVLEAVHHVRKQRGNVALQNEGFQEQLVALARKHNLLGAKPGEMGAFVKESPPQFDVRNDWRSQHANSKKQNPLDRLS